MTGRRVLSPRARAFVNALASGLNQTEAAAALGVSARSCRRYYANPLVRHALAEAQDLALGDVARKMNAGAGEMLDVLRDVAQDGTMPAAVRVRAALGWLEVTFKAKELLELAQRVSELEQRLAVTHDD